MQMKLAYSVPSSQTTIRQPKSRVRGRHGTNKYFISFIQNNIKSSAYRCQIRLQNKTYENILIKMNTLYIANKNNFKNHDAHFICLKKSTFS